MAPCGYSESPKPSEIYHCECTIMIQSSFVGPSASGHWHLGFSPSMAERRWEVIYTHHTMEVYMHPVCSIYFRGRLTYKELWFTPQFSPVCLSEYASTVFCCLAQSRAWRRWRNVGITDTSTRTVQIFHKIGQRLRPPGEVGWVLVAAT